MEEPNIVELTEKFDNYLRIIDLYNNLVGELSEIPAASQYEEAKNWLNDTSDVIAKHIIMCEIDQTENINILEKTILSLRNFTDLFKGGELSEPIFNITEFHDLLNKSGFDLVTKVSIKKAVGKANYNLATGKTLQSEEIVNYIDKYKLIYEKDFSVYGEEIKKIEEIILKDNLKLSIENALDNITHLFNLIPEFTAETITNFVVSILLKKEIETYEDFIKENLEANKEQEFKNKIINNCEQIIMITKKQLPKEQTTKEEKNEQILIQGNQLIDQSKQIIEAESKLLEKEIYSNEENFSHLVSTNTGEDNELMLAIIVNSIKQSISLLEEYLTEYNSVPEIYEQKCKEQILNINEYIETYHIVKKRLDITDNKRNKK